MRTLVFGDHFNHDLEQVHLPELKLLHLGRRFRCHLGHMPKLKSLAISQARPRKLDVNDIDTDLTCIYIIYT